MTASFSIIMMEDNRRDEHRCPQRTLGILRFAMPRYVEGPLHRQDICYPFV